MSFVPERPSSGGSHSAYLETKDAIYHLISCLDGLVPRIVTRRERVEIFELISRLERVIIDLFLAEELEESVWGPPLGAPEAEAGTNGEAGGPGGEARPDTPEPPPPFA